MHPSSQRVLMLEAPRGAHIVERPLAPPGPGDVVVRSLYSTFKHGTEMMAYRGETPHASRVFNPSLRLFENAPAPFYPRPMGSMVVGAVDWAGEQAGDLRPGDRVFGFAPIADVHVMPAANVGRLGALTPEQALCIDPASFALGGVLEKKESGEIPSGDAPAASAAAPAETEAPAAEAEAETTNDDQDAEAPDAGATESTEDPAEGPDTTEETQEG